MSKQRWYIVPLVAGLVALAATGGAIFAQGNSGDPVGIRHQGIMTRVAEILGLDQATVEDAFRQAHQEQRDARFQSRLGRLVAKDILTQAEADAIAEWYQARPVTDLPLRRLFHANEVAVGRILDRMVAADRITREEADAVVEWYREKPEVLSELSSSHGPADRGDRFRGRRFHHGLKPHGLKPGDSGTTTDTRFDGASGGFILQANPQNVS